MLGRLKDGHLTLEEVHRFPNRSYAQWARLFWDFAHLENEIFAGVRKAAARGEPIDGISTDSWAVDYVLLDAQGTRLADPHCYRDPWTADATKRLLARVPFAEIYHETGIQFMALNTIFHLEAQQFEAPGELARADHFLMIADYFNAQFSGVEVVDASNASTTQVYEPRRGEWSEKLLAALQLPRTLFPRIVPCGTVLGPASTRWPELGQAKVIASCSHDTAAAVAAVPAQGKNWAYLSSGTWSLLGAELDAPLITDAAAEAGFTNEVGLSGTVRLLKNIAGLWVLQECRRAWEAEGQATSYDELVQLASKNGPASAHISLRDPRFLAPGEMPRKIADYCRETSQPVPQGLGAFTRTILESLAQACAETLRELERVTGQRFERLHIVGGGSRNRLLNQLTANAAGVPVLAGPAEATATGNVLVQALALGHLTSAAQVRRVVEKSFATEQFLPEPKST
jgi:rhamnulokinase